jgi:hypothetical protein
MAKTSFNAGQRRAQGKAGLAALSKAALQLTGDAMLIQRLQRLPDKVQRKGLKPGMQKATRTIAKGIKAAIPVQYKGAKRMVGNYVKPTRKTGGIMTAKVGLGVGKQHKVVVQRTGKNLTQGSRGVAKPVGVGMGGKNAHWFAIGTGERQQKTTGISVGAMPAVLGGVVERGFNAMSRRAGDQIAETIAAVLAKEGKG